MIASAFLAQSCNLAISTPSDMSLKKTQEEPSIEANIQDPYPFLPPTRIPGTPILTPTADAPHALPQIRAEDEEYFVQPNDTLKSIALRKSISLEALLAANDVPNPDLISVGLRLVIPPPEPFARGPGFKIIPDSELVFGPASAAFDLSSFIQDKGGFLNNYAEDISGEKFSAEEILIRVGQEYSVNPRILLALLEYRCGCLSQENPPQEVVEDPLRMGASNPWQRGLYKQLAWAADGLNRGYYLWKVNGLPAFVLEDGSSVTPADTINAGTAGVQFFLGQMLTYYDWLKAVGPQGLISVYTSLFGYPFDLAIEPLVPSDLIQPNFQLPFEEGVIWSFTGGPHGGWGNGSGWAALDFAPPGNELGCVSSNAWVTAVADGLITRSEWGIVILDLDGDGFEETGWTVLYLHIESRDRVRIGTHLKSGERIGHPSCEGGASTGTHIHLARRYNGEWVSADGPLPFILDGWISGGNGIIYDGILKKDGQVVEAWNGRKPENQITR